jgi:hypothetical protein
VSCLDSLCGEVFVVIFEGFDFEHKSLAVTHESEEVYLPQLSGSAWNSSLKTLVF